MERLSNEQDILYRKIYGAVAWPGKRPGFAVIIGQKKEFRLGGYDLQFLDEVEEDDIQKLVKACVGFDFFYRPDKWYGDTKNAAADRFIREANKEAGPRDGRPFKLTRTRVLDMKNCFDYTYPVLKEMLAKDKRRLFLKDGSRLQSYMYQPQPSDIPKIEFGEYPAIEALAFAALELQQAKDKSELPKFALNDYKLV